MAAPTRLRGYVAETVFGEVLEDLTADLPADLAWPQSTATYTQMLRDPKVNSAVTGYSLHLRRAQWQLNPQGCRPEVVNLVADDLGLPVMGREKVGAARVRGVSWTEYLRAALLSLPIGHMGFELEATVGARARLTTLAERLPATINRIHVNDRTGALDGITQMAADWRLDTPQIPADRLVWHVHDRVGAAWWGRSMLRSSWAPWLVKREMLKVNAISHRRWSAGVSTMEALPGTQPTPAQMQEALALATQARAGDQAGAVSPPGFTHKIKGIEGSLPDTLGFLRFLNQEIAGALLMPHLELGTTETGSRALAEAFTESWMLALGAIGEDVCDVTTRQIVARLVDWNFGPDEPVPAVVVSGIGARRDVTAESLKLLLDAGALSADPRLEQWVRREFRLPERDEPTRPPVASGERAAAAKVDPPGLSKTSRRRPRPSGQMALFAAGPDELQKDWEQAKADLLEQWPEQSEDLIESLAAAAAAVAAAGALTELGSLAAGSAVVAAIAALLAGSMSGLAVAAAATAVAEVAAAGGQASAPADPGADRIGRIAQAHADQIAAGYAQAAGRKALTLAGPGADGTNIDAAVREHLAEMSKATKGLVGDVVGSALTAAQASARLAVFEAFPNATYVASEENDPVSSRCKACTDVNGTEYDGLAAALLDYPTYGYSSCAGGSRCRGGLRLKAL